MASSERTEGASTAPSAASFTTHVAPADTVAGTGLDTQGRRLSGPEAAKEAIEACTVSCLTNAQYHACREAYLDTIHRWFMFLVIAFGGAAITDILPQLTGTDAKLTTDLLVAGGAVLAALDLTFDLSNRARAHAMMN
jgi:hypothetical protein